MDYVEKYFHLSHHRGVRRGGNLFMDNPLEEFLG